MCAPLWIALSENSDVRALCYVPIKVQRRKQHKCTNPFSSKSVDQHNSHFKAIDFSPIQFLLEYISKSEEGVGQRQEHSKK